MPQCGAIIAGICPGCPVSRPETNSLPAKQIRFTATLKQRKIWTSVCCCRVFGRIKGSLTGEQTILRVAGPLRVLGKPFREGEAHIVYHDVLPICRRLQQRYCFEPILLELLLVLLRAEANPGELTRRIQEESIVSVLEAVKECFQLRMGLLQIARQKGVYESLLSSYIQTGQQL